LSVRLYIKELSLHLFSITISLVFSGKSAVILAFYEGRVKRKRLKDKDEVGRMKDKKDNYEVGRMKDESPVFLQNSYFSLQPFLSPSLFTLLVSSVILLSVRN